MLSLEKSIHFSPEPLVNHLNFMKRPKYSKLSSIPLIL